MGYDCSAQLWVGLRVDERVLREKTRKRGCDHPENDGAFCPTCGVPMWEEDWEMPEWAETERHHNLDVGRDYSESYILLVGKEILSIGESTSDRNSAKVPDFDKESIFAKVREEFEDKGWFKEEMLGVWLVRHESY